MDPTVRKSPSRIAWGNAWAKPSLWGEEGYPRLLFLRPAVHLLDKQVHRPKKGGIQNVGGSREAVGFATESGSAFAHNEGKHEGVFIQTHFSHTTGERLPVFTRSSEVYPLMGRQSSILVEPFSPLHPQGVA
jgi:hypothetical protein